MVIANIPRVRAVHVIIAATLLFGCAATQASAQSHGQHQRRNADAAFSSDSARRFSGMASYYGNESGRKTASGALSNENSMTAAHRSLPFGTRLKVTYAGRSVVVTINDRGPFVRGRVLDLSIDAARAIGLTGRGVGRVDAEAM
jgi:rare lipoprotein A